MHETGRPGGRRRGFSLVETLLSVMLFSLMSGVLYLAVDRGTRVFRTVDAHTDAQRSLRLANSWLSRDVQSSSIRQMAFKHVTTSTGECDAFWFLSPLDPTVRGPNAHVMVRDTATGLPIWQRTILYYCVRSSGHNAEVGQACAVDTNPNGDGICPHKFLIRKVINLPANPEVMLTSAQIDAYTTRPSGYNISGFASEGGLESTRIIANNFLSFSVHNAGSTPLVQVDLRTVRVSEARKNIPIGSASLLQSPYTLFNQTAFAMYN